MVAVAESTSIGLLKRKPSVDHLTHDGRVDALFETAIIAKRREFSRVKERRKTPQDLRSARWYGANDMRGFAHRQRTQQMGFRRDEFVGRPVIAIVNTWSDMSPCHAHLRERAEAVKRGIWQAGGFPVELPAMSVGEVIVKPT